uniref:Stereocilin n=1 Tax=Cynoglossus semilaevis TaxID=244447 RepID=A0A3P8V8D0_CYNSE
ESGNRDQRNAFLKEILSKWSKGDAPQKDPEETSRDQLVHPWVRNIMGSLKSLGLFPSTSLPSLNKPIDRHRLSGFLYNISLYLQEMGAELEEAPTEPDEEQLWEKVLQFLLQPKGNGAANQWNGRVPPRPSLKVQDWFLSLRGSPHWDWLLGLLQSLITLSERQPHRPLMTLLSQNWRTVSAVLEAGLQALVSGTYGQASAGLQGFICALKGQSDCTFNVSWLQQLLRLVESRNWKPVVSVHPVGQGAAHSKDSGAFGRVKPFSMLPEAMRQDGIKNTSLEEGVESTDDPDFVQNLLLDALSRSGVGGERGGYVAQRNMALVQSLDGLRRGLLHRVGSSVYSNLRQKVSQVTMAMLDDVSSLVDVPQSSGQGRCSEDLRRLILAAHPSPTRSKQNRLLLPHFSLPQMERADQNQVKDLDFFTTSEILEAACNESIPGLTGVSNFTVFLYCKLFEGENQSVRPAGGQMGLDLHATCSDAAWYLSAAEDDFLWLHVCSEFFAHEFNNTVCANSSFWLQKAQQQAAVTKDYSFFNQTNIDDLCVHLSEEASGSLGLDESCLAQVGSGLLTAQVLRHCFLPNSSVLISSLCSSYSVDSHRSLSEPSWVAAYCSKLLNASDSDSTEEMCRYREWAVDSFTNTTLLEHCEQTPGLKEYMCANATVYGGLLRQPQFAEFCADLQAEHEDKKCFLQRFFDMLPARYDFDTSQLCVDPAPLLVDVLHKLSVCEVEGGRRESFLLSLGYVLRVLDFMVGLSSGLDEGEREARQGLGQAILLSSLLDNTSWSSLQPKASMSVLQTVGVFLRGEQNTTLKEDLLGCFSPLLWDLIQRDNNSSALRVLMQEYLQMPRDTIRTLVMSAEKDAVKRFLSHMHQSWDQLQVEPSQASRQEVEAMETMTAAFIHKFPRVTPELFVDLSQFIPFMSVSDIMSFPASLIVNDTLTAIRDHSSGMKSLQKRAFVKRLLQSNVVGDVETWPPYFLGSILPLLPFLPVSRFQQLTSQQLTPLVELLGNSSLDAVRGRHVLRTVFVKKRNLTSDYLSLGVLACYLDPADLGRYLQESSVSSALWQQLAQCMSKGFISSSGRLSSWLIPAVKTVNISSLSPPSLPGLQGLTDLLPQLGSPVLLSLPSQQMMELLSQPGLHRYPPAQALGQIAGGMTCDLFKLWANDTEFSELLHLVTDLSGAIRPAMQRKCIIEELRSRPDLDLTLLNPRFAASLLTMMESLSNSSFRAVLDQVQADFAEFLKLPHYKQTNLAEKARAELVDVLGPLVPFLDRDSLSLVDRGALGLRLEEMRSFCLPREALRDISALLTHKDMLWQVEDVEHLGRLVFSLSPKQISSIPSKDTVEQVLVGQRPSCADIRGTFPSAWTPTQFSRMSEEDLDQCVEVLGQDSSLNSQQRRSLWVKLRQPVRDLRPEQILALGSVVTEMGERELQDVDLSDPVVLTHLGTLTDWSPKKMRAVVLGVMRRRKLRVEHLTMVDMVTFGHLICGLYPSELKRLNPYNLEMSLPCTEKQMEALTSRLFRPEAFGPVSAWGPEVFTEIGTLAGLEDIVLSALVQEQVEGLTPPAISLMSPEKISVVFSPAQLSWLTMEQAWAVTEEQWTELDPEQRHAVGLARYDG